MEVRTHTAGGSIERGHANQRHLVRRIDNEIDGVRVVCSYNIGKVSVSARSVDGLRAVLDAAAEYGAEPEFGLDSDLSWQYEHRNSDDAVAVEVVF